MFRFSKRIILKNTDATGVLYFGSVFDYALEAFEEFLHARGQYLPALLNKGYLFPIVHAEADYKGFILLGDELEIQLAVTAITDRSFTHTAFLYKQGLVASVKIVHAFVLKGESRASCLPTDFKELLLSICKEVK